VPERFNFMITYCFKRRKVKSFENCLSAQFNFFRNSDACAVQAEEERALVESRGPEGYSPMRFEKGAGWRWMFRFCRALGKWIELVTFIDFLRRASILMSVSQTRMDRKMSCALLIREKDGQGLSTGTRP